MPLRLMFLFCYLVTAAIAQSNSSLRFQTQPPLAPPAGSSSVVRDICANFWALVPAGQQQKQLFVLPAQAPAQWVPVEVKGVTIDAWQNVAADEDGYIWLSHNQRSIRFDPRKPELGALEARKPFNETHPDWQVVAKMPASNHDLTAAVLRNKFYVAGGLTADWGFPARSHPFDELWELNPQTWVWRVAAKLHRPRIYCVTASFDNKIWVIGGDVFEADNSRHAITTVEMIDPRSGKVTQGVASTIARPMPMALVANHRLYVMGNAKGEYDAPAKIESIGKGEQSWRQEPDGPGGMGPLAGAALGDKLFVVVPKKGLAVFDAKLHTWELIPMAEIPRSCQMAAYRGEIWMMGGQDISDKTQTMIYSPRTKKFRKGPSLPRPMSWGAAATVNGQLIFTGGAALRSDTDRIYVYNDRTYVLRESK